MKFDLKRPCAQCPFRTDIKPYLRPERAEEIGEALLAGQTFTCHKTVDYDLIEEDDEGCETHYLGGDKDQHCAGAMIFLEAQERPNQLMRIAERFGGYDYTKLDMDAPVVRCLEEFVDMMKENG